MSKIDDQTVPAALQRYLQPGEQLLNYAYGVKQPNIGLILLFYATVGGAVAVAFLTKHYVVGLTDRRVIVLSLKPGFFTRCHLDRVVETFDFPLAQLGAMKVKTSTGALFTHMRVDAPGRTWVAKFHRMGMSRNRDHSMAIAAALSNPHAGLQGGAPVPQLAPAAPPAYGAPPPAAYGGYGPPAQAQYGYPNQPQWQMQPQGSHGHPQHPQPGYPQPQPVGYGQYPATPQGGHGQPAQPQQVQGPQHGYPQGPPAGHGPYPGGGPNGGYRT